MLIETARRGHAAAKEMLALVNEGSASCEEMREMLGANPGICQGHHIEPASQGGPTKLDNLVPACWTCHHRIHHDGWQIHKRPDGNHTLHPPDTVSFGPARAPDHAPARLKPDTQHDPDPPPPPPRPAPSRGDPGISASPPPEPLFVLT